MHEDHTLESAQANVRRQLMNLESRHKDLPKFLWDMGIRVGPLTPGGTPVVFQIFCLREFRCRNGSLDIL